MMDRKVEHVLCAVRGGPESRETVTRAIDLVLEHNATLTFFHVIDVEFLEHATIGPLSVVYKELEEMSRFAMLILMDRAQRRGVKKVDFTIAQGNLRKQFMDFALETKVDVIVMGRPIRSPGRNMFTPESFDAFVGELSNRGNFTLVEPHKHHDTDSSD